VSITFDHHHPSTLTVAPSVDEDLTIRLRGLRRAFGDHVVLDGIDLDVPDGQILAVLGRSGCGKSTLLRALAGLDRDTTGLVHVAGTTAVVFQEPRLLPWKRVWRNVALGLDGDGRSRALAALDEVELSHRVNVWPLTLSGGEAQRAALARALVRDPALLLLDEPFGALDALTRIRMHRLLAELTARHAPTVVLVTHDVDEAVLLADRAIVLADGGIKADVTIPLAGARRRTDPAFAAVRHHLLGELGVEDDR
jgi:sulfonate transport system ATP-binding protein